MIKFNKSSLLGSFLSLIKKYKYFFIIKLGIKLIILLAFFTSSCNNNQLIKEVEQYYNDSIPAIENYYILKDSTKTLVKRIKYFPNGLKEIEGEFDEKGLRTGHWRYWTDKGNIWSEGYFKNGKRNGFGTVWHKNAGKFYEGNSIDDIQDGTWKYWTKQGKLIKEVEFNMGKIISEKQY